MLLGSLADEHATEDGENRHHGDATGPDPKITGDAHGEGGSRSAEFDDDDDQQNDQCDRAANGCSAGQATA